MIYMDTYMTDINTTDISDSDRYISVAKELETAESATTEWDCEEFLGTDVNIDTATITELSELDNESECVDLADINTTMTGPNRYIAVFPDEEVANSESMDDNKDSNITMNEFIGIRIASLCLDLNNTQKDTITGFLSKEIPRKYSNVNVFVIQNIKTEMYTDILREMKMHNFSHHRFPDLGCDIFVKNDYAKIVKCDRKPFTSTQQNKTWTLVQIQLKGDFRAIMEDNPLVNIFTYVLEEGSRGAICKREQVKELGKMYNKIVDGDTPTILIGNTQITSFDRIDTPKGFTDLWEEIGDDENEYTVDGRNNPFVNSVYVLDRRERLWYSKHFSAESLYLLSKHVDPPVSENFGIVGHLSFFSNASRDGIAHDIC